MFFGDYCHTGPEANTYATLRWMSQFTSCVSDVQYSAVRRQSAPQSRPTPRKEDGVCATAACDTSEVCCLRVTVVTTKECGNDDELRHLLSCLRLTLCIDLSAVDMYTLPLNAFADSVK